jgi:ABC-type multidrug transport system fused ATPase/permease subunit
MNAALAGVVISSLFGITGSIGWLDFATSLISRSAPHVRRVFEFVDLPREEQEERVSGPLVTPETFAAPHARQELEGDLIFENYTMSYRKDTPVILHSLNLRLARGCKTAMIGRTGSGKTSIIQALLRMVYVHRGDIRIGERSIYSMDLYELRRLFGVVPQLPYLFAGNVRSNLDRLGDLPDHTLSHALESVGLNLALKHPVTEGGSNLSLGERQLVCLARVIAAERSIILMDEPTSGLDPETDARIHHVLKTAFQGRTVITIAHRPESLGNYDRVVELQGGKLLKS